MRVGTAYHILVGTELRTKLRRGVKALAGEFFRNGNPPPHLTLASAGSQNIPLFIPQVLVPNSALMTWNPSGGSVAVDVGLIANKIMSLLASPEQTYQREEIIRRFNQDFGRRMRVRLDGELYSHAIELLQVQKRIEICENGGIRFYNQGAAIMKVGEQLSQDLLGVNNLHELAETISKTTRGLFMNFDLYLRDGASGEMLIITGNKDGSTYQNWTQMENNGVFHKMVKGRIRFKYFRDIAGVVDEEGPIFPHNIERYRQRYNEPRETIYIVESVAGRKGGIAVKLNEWNSKNSLLRDRYLYSENPEISRAMVNGALEGLVAAIADRVGRIISRYPDLTFKEIWEEEEVKRDVVPALRPEDWKVAITVMPDQEEGKAGPKENKYLPGSKLVRIERRDKQNAAVKLTLELIRDPSRYLAGRAARIVEDMIRNFIEAWGQVAKTLDRSVLAKYISDAYWRRAEKIVFLRGEGDRSETRGFAVLTRETVEDKTVFRMAGTNLDPVLQEMRLSVKLNSLMVSEAWRENAHLSGGRIHLVTLSANPRVVGSTQVLANVFPNPHKPNVKPTEEQKKVFRALAKRWFPDCEVDEEHFIIRGALRRGLGGLVYQKEELQLYRDPKVNEYCLSLLNFENGDLFMVMGDYSRRVVFRIFIKGILRKLGEWGRRISIYASRKFHSLTF